MRANDEEKLKGNSSPPDEHNSDEDKLAANEPVDQNNEEDKLTANHNKADNPGNDEWEQVVQNSKKMKQLVKAQQEIPIFNRFDLLTVEDDGLKVSIFRELNSGFLQTMC